MKRHKTKRSEFSYKEIIRSLLWYRWDYAGGEDEEGEKKYYRLYHIANAKFCKKYFKKSS